MKDIAQCAARRDAVIVAGVVLLYLAAAWLIARKLGLFTPDPDYQYFLNGLNILRLKAPNQYDHPGTPVQLIIALVMGLAWLLTLARHGLSNLPDDVLARPQFYMTCVSIVFTAGIAASMTFFLWSMRKASGTIMPAVLALLTAVPPHIAYLTFHRIMPEPLLLCATMMLAGLLVPVAFAPNDQPTTPRMAIWIGILLGFCVTAKVTSMPVLLVILALRSNKARANALIATGLSALAFLFPIWSLWRPLLGNYFRIATHTGAYGSGATGLPAPAEIWSNIVSLMTVVPQLFLCSIVYALILLVFRARRRSLPASFARILLVCALIATVAITLVAKQPHPYYLVPVVAFICLGNALVFSYVFEKMPIPKWCALILAIPFAIWAYAIFSMHADVDSSGASADQRLMETVAGKGCLLVRYYGVHDQQFNLFFGNLGTGEIYGDRLSRIYPDFLAYNTYYKEFQTYQARLPLEAARKRLASAHCIYLAGIPWEADFGIPATSVKLVGKSKSGLSLYALAPDWDTSAYGRR